MVLLYTTAEVDRQIGEWQLTNRRENLEEAMRREGMGGIAAQARRHRSPRYLFQWGRYRVFGYLLQISGRPVLHLCKAFRRGDAAYASFDYEDLSEPEEWATEEWVAVNLNRIAPGLVEGAVQEPQPLPALLEEWLLPPEGILDKKGGLAVYESIEWVRQMERVDRAYWLNYRDLIVQVCELVRGGEGDAAGEPHYTPGGGVGIWHCRVVVDGPSAHSVILLLALTEPNADAGGVPAQAHEGITELDQVAALSQRTYPEYLLYDDGAWLAIEENEAANLALSGEEEGLLRTTSAPTGEMLTLPLLINGRAGSGKTTMLWFLYAQYCDRFLQSPHRACLPTPIYLTYSESLLERAGEGVLNILKHHAKYVASGGAPPEKSSVDSLFSVFLEYVRGLLPLGMRGRFGENNYIDFHRFRSLYYNQEPGGRGFQQAGNRRFSADEAWHAIRSYVKGWCTDIASLDDVLPPEDYCELPRDDRTLTEDMYQDIFSTVWSGWYRQLTGDGGFWDDQDLIRQALLEGDLGPGHTAVFCDEAQDFTRIETDLIRRLSVFSRYEIAPPVSCLPFAFGGDPCQTLSPTGFRWENLGVMLQEGLIDVVLPQWQRNYTLGLQRFDLTRNYRSTEPIVKVCNVVLLWRRLVGESIEPQRPWASPGGPPPGLYVLGDGSDAESLRQNARNVTIIVPVGSNQLADYIEGDEVLRTMVTEEQAVNVYSVADAKGLEFDKVVVYKFGEACPSIDWDHFADHSDSLELRYFLNRLYVALTRAKSDLFIIDTAQGYERLWQHATPEAIQASCALADASRPGSSWGDLTTGLDRITTLPNLDEGIDLVAQATRLKEWGIENRSASLLDRAKGYYERAHRDREAILCGAYALEYRRQSLAAGEQFAGLGMQDDAWRCYWEGCHWAELHLMLSEYADLRPGHPARLLTPFIVGVRSLQQFSGDLVARLDEGLVVPEAAAQWVAVAANMRDQVGNPGTDWGPDGAPVGRAAEELTRRGYLPLQVAALAYHRSGLHQRAVELFEKCKADCDEYRRSKAEVVGMPGALEWLLGLSDRAKAAQEVIGAWEAEGSPNAPAWLRYVAVALQRAGRGDEAARAYLRIGEAKKARQAFDAWDSAGVAGAKREEGKTVLGDLIEALVSEGWGSEAIDALRDPHRLELDDSELLVLRCRLVRALARSNEAWGAHNPQRQLSGILRAVSSSDGWEMHASWEELGAAYERSGFLSDTLKFYHGIAERILAAAPAARRRWVATKISQVSYLKERRQEDNANKQRSVLDDQRRAWGIDEHEEIPQYPVLTELAAHDSAPGLRRP
ncbi:hypothetical protein LLH03_01105, partial [bacterium]|nr:hypothetical protein [bacterium]